MKSELIPIHQYRIQITMETDEANELAKDIEYAITHMNNSHVRPGLYTQLATLRNHLLGVSREKQPIPTFDNKSTSQPEPRQGPRDL